MKALRVIEGREFDNRFLCKKAGSELYRRAGLNIFEELGHAVVPVSRRLKNWLQSHVMTVSSF